MIISPWEIRPLSDIAEVRTGFAKNTSVTVTQPVSVHYLRVANVQDGFLDLSDVSRINVSRSDLQRFAVLPGDVLMNEGGDLDKLGRGAIWNGAFDPCIHQNHVFVVRCSAAVRPAYLRMWSSGSVSRRYFLVAGKQTTNLASISKTALSQLPVAVPPLHEQDAIAEALSDVDALLAGLDRLIAKKRDLKQAAMQQLLTGRTRISGFSRDWVHRRVADMGHVLAGKALNEHGQGVQRPYLRTKNVLDGQINLDDILYMPMTDSEFDKFRIEPGDVLLNEGQSLELVGRCSMYRGELPLPCAMQNQLLRFRARDGASPAFAEHLFRHCQRSGVFSAIATQTTSVAHLGSSRFSRLQLLWPSDSSEQEAIASVLSDMDAEICGLEARRDKTLSLKQAMMQELLTGRIRLV